MSNPAYYVGYNILSVRISHRNVYSLFPGIGGGVGNEPRGRGEEESSARSSIPEEYGFPRFPFGIAASSFAPKACAEDPAELQMAVHRSRHRDQLTDSSTIDSPITRKYFCTSKRTIG